MIGQREALRLSGCEVFDPVGQRVGIVGRPLLDEHTELPSWVTVQNGIFGTNERFVPLAGAAFDGDTLTVAVSREAVRYSPRVQLVHGDLLLEQEQSLRLHYGLDCGAETEPPGSQVSRTPPRGFAEAVRLRLRRWTTVI